MVCLSDFLLFFLRWGKVSNGVNMTPTSYVQLARCVYHWKIIICDGTWDDWWFFTLQIIMNTVVYFSFFLLFSLYHFVAPDKVFHGYNSSCSWLAFLQDHLKSQWNEWMGYSHLELETLSWETATLTLKLRHYFQKYVQILFLYANTCSITDVYISAQKEKNFNLISTLM